MTTNKTCQTPLRHDVLRQHNDGEDVVSELHEPLYRRRAIYGQ